ncbi:hypothetical protein Tco_0740346 [Tanacetum coccineum]
MQGTKLSLQEKECKLYDEFHKFSFVKSETLYQYYWRFAQLINNMNVINMSMRPVQVNTEFLNSLPTEWSKFVTDIKLARDLHTTNYDQLYSYLEQHEAHANETRLMRAQYQDPLSFVANYNQPPSHITNYISYNGDESNWPCPTWLWLSVCFVAYFKVPFNKKSIRTSSNPRNQAQYSRRQGLLAKKCNGGKDKGYAGTGNKGPWLGNALRLEVRGTLHDPSILDGQAAQTTILNNVAFQTEYLDAYDVDYDDVFTAKAVLFGQYLINLLVMMVISDVPHFESYHNDLDNQTMHAMQDFEQTPVIYFLDNEITSDSNIILYS